MAPIVPVAPMHKLYAINCKENKRKILESLIRVFTVHNNQAFKCGVISVLLGLGFFFLLSHFNLSNEEEVGAENTGINTCSKCKCPVPGHISIGRNTMNSALTWNFAIFFFLAA